MTPTGQASPIHLRTAICRSVNVFRCATSTFSVRSSWADPKASSESQLVGSGPEIWRGNNHWRKSCETSHLHQSSAQKVSNGGGLAGHDLSIDDQRTYAELLAEPRGAAR
jgi:hypothetical protein